MSNVGLRQIGPDVNVLSGFAFNSAFFTTAPAIPLIRIRDLFSDTTEVNYSGLYSEDYLVDTGDILIGMDGDFHAVKWRGAKALLNQRVCRVATNSRELCQDYLYHWLQPKLDEIHRRTPQTTVRHLSTGDLEKIEIPFLELGDQKRAAEILDLADEAIVKTEVLIAKLKAIKQGLLHDLLTRGLDDNGELRDPEKHPDSFADTPLGRYPANWDLAPFAKYVADWAVGPRFSGKFYASDGNIATLRTTDMDDEGNLCLSTMPLARLNVDAFRTHLLRPGDLVISRSGTCGIASVFSGHDCPVLPGAFLLRFRLNDGMSPDFARLYFNSPMGRTRVVWEAEGGVQKNIRGTSVLPIVMVVPTLAEQKEIVARVGSLSHHLSAEDAYLSKLKAIKKGLMQDLLNGRVRVAATRRERPAIGSQERSRRVL